jgi:hypothetical protein
VCGKKVSTCCVKCSTGTVIVPLCPLPYTYKGQEIKSHCATQHGRDPLTARRSCSHKKAGTKASAAALRAQTRERVKTHKSGREGERSRAGASALLSRPERRATVARDQGGGGRA